MTASSLQLKRSIGQQIVMLTLSFWLSSSLIFGLGNIPSLYVSGMMTQSGFPTAARYLLFFGILIAIWCVSAALSSNRVYPAFRTQRGAIVLSTLLVVSLVDTYFF